MKSNRPWSQRVLDRTEALLWARQDERMRAAGWEVIPLGRWHRQYRHPHWLAKGLPAARLRAERETRLRAERETRLGAECAAPLRVGYAPQRAATARAGVRQPGQRNYRYRHPVPAGSATLLPGESITPGPRS
jgi:hypothetical protein